MNTPFRRACTSLGFAALAAGIPGAVAAQKANPCAAQKSASAANPCAAKNPCGAKNPCAASGKVDRKLVIRPKGTKLMSGTHAELVKFGEALYKDKKLSTNGMACESCHAGGASFAPGFAKPYPHAVAMAKEKSGVARVHLDEMVQFCMVVPMAAKPLSWDSKELAALTAYTAQVQKSFKPVASKGNPCAARNPCAAK